MGILSLVATGQRGQQLIFRVYNSICSRPYIYVIISCSVVSLQTRREQGVKPVWCTYLSARLESAVFSTCIRLSVCPSVCTRSERHVQGVAARRPFLDASTKSRLIFYVARTNSYLSVKIVISYLF